MLIHVTLDRIIYNFLSVPREREKKNVIYYLHWNKKNLVMNCKYYWIYVYIFREGERGEKNDFAVLWEDLEQLQNILWRIDNIEADSQRCNLELLAGAFLKFKSTYKFLQGLQFMVHLKCLLRKLCIWNRGSAWHIASDRRLILMSGRTE